MISSNSCCLFADIFATGLGGGESFFGGGATVSAYFLREVRQPARFSSSGLGLGRDALGGAFANAPRIPPDIDLLAVVATGFTASVVLHYQAQEEKAGLYGCV